LNSIATDLADGCPDIEGSLSPTGQNVRQNQIFSARIFDTHVLGWKNCSEIELNFFLLKDPKSTDN
jgi:hypothetical protein